ncbi:MULTISPECIES: benzoate/H(+) symporter BenE family transporter [unclassified Paludibacterium]|uniref:benzoate/H(+) symporter BenE family transporter n=1 Tax=unclassified Paludibacterium TaxID=2618429 RepID=UPI001C056AF7|nr:benzoate/H(+) symporter BenE family transporter [Paludibacterium sp. B53371]BEV72805.1 benzoate/H(+) symporter BenE family transporter [Paludibacterium sp. THUN1379]
MGWLKQWAADSSLSAIQAGVIAVIVSFAGPSVLMYQAAHAAHFSAALTSSWLGAASIGSGLVGLVLSLRYRMPVVIAWSTPGAALLVTMLPGHTPGEAVAAYLAAALLIGLIGWSGVFDVLMRRLPASIASAMLAGILFRFGAELFTSIALDPLLVLSMLAIYLLMRRWRPRYAVLAVLLGGLLLLLAQGRMHWPDLSGGWTQPVWVTPTWSWQAVLNLGLPLALVALSGQYLPGMAVLRADGYALPSRPMVAANALVSLLIAPFGAHGINPAAITAAICTGPEAHPQPQRRYIAGVVCGLLYLLAGLAAGSLILLFAAVPKTWVAALSGMALLGAIGNGLTTAMRDESQREAALMTFLLTASGMHFLGMGAAFWGIVAGVLAHVVKHLHWRQLWLSLRPGT